MSQTSAAVRALEPCVHCGLCLQSCPTYRASGDESEGPRGRIVLMQSMLSGLIDRDDPNATSHLETCLGCRACETSCPSGVEYGHGLENTRALLKTAKPFRVRALMDVLASPRMSRAFFSLSRILRKATSLQQVRASNTSLALLSGTRPRAGRSARTTNPAQSRHHERTVNLFTGCVMDGLFGHVHDATRRVLAANGFSVNEVPEQVCCGALHAHYGDRRDAGRLASENVAAFEAQPGPVVVNSAGCGAMLKDYPLIAGDEARSFSSRVYDVTEFLCEHDVRPGAPMDVTVAYEPPCHLQHAQRIVDQPKQLLNSIPDLRVIEAPGSDQCCGSAGVYSLLQPETASLVVDAKMQSLACVDADVIATGNPGCIMQLNAGMETTEKPIPVVHPIEILDWSYGEAGFYL